MSATGGPSMVALRFVAPVLTGEVTGASPHVPARSQTSPRWPPAQLAPVVSGIGLRSPGGARAHCHQLTAPRPGDQRCTPTLPIAPARPLQPMQATQPEQLTHPTQATQPAQPTFPRPARMPADPTTTALSATPALPTIAVLPATPALPTTPAVPAIPAEAA